MDLLCTHATAAAAMRQPDRDVVSPLRMKTKRLVRDISHHWDVARNHWRFGGFRQVYRYCRGKLEARLGDFHFSRTHSNARYCPCCEWQGRRFRPYFAGGYTTLDALCPQCNSHARHRGQMLYYRDHLRLLERKGRLLYFAPESGILPHLRAAGGLQVETTDYGKISGADHRYDIMNMAVPSGTFDFLICHRVIEHVPDDRRAMRELYRILKPGGLAIISVPISRQRSQTLEFGRPNPLCDDHYYDYGSDVCGRIPAEFRVTELLFSGLFDHATFKHLALQEDSIFECRKPEELPANEQTTLPEERKVSLEL